MTMQSTVVGADEVVAKLLGLGATINDRVFPAVDATGAQVVNDAKAHHESGAHSAGRYENKTTLLTNSMMSRTKADRAGVTSAASANRDYAADVELGSEDNRPYPYMYPALVGNMDLFIQNLKKVL